LRNAIDID
jgi:3-deoxy-7-phosphoheptulonate synthase